MVSLKHDFCVPLLVTRSFGALTRRQQKLIFLYIHMAHSQRWQIDALRPETLLLSEGFNIPAMAACKDFSVQRSGSFVRLQNA